MKKTTTTKKTTAKAAVKVTKKATTKRHTKSMPEISDMSAPEFFVPESKLTVDDVKAKGIVVKPLDPAKVAALTIGINLTCVRFGNSRRADLNEIDMHGTDVTLVKFHKQLLKSKELSAIHMLDYRAGDYLRMIGLPSFFKPGTHRVPIASVDEVEARLAEFAEDRAVLVAKFIEKYPALIESMKPLLGPQFKASDYPTVEAARDRFEFSWRWFEVDGAPGRLQSISAAAFESAKKRVAESMMEIAQGCRVALRGYCLEIVREISKRLTPKNGDERKKFRSSTLLRDVTEFFRTFEVRNVTDDAELAAVVAQLRDLTGSVDLDTIKTDAALTLEFKANVDAVAASLDDLLVDADARMITLN